jgi:hypothetical protein
MKLSVPLMTLVPICLCLTACGGAHSSAVSSADGGARVARGLTLPQPELKVDAELDSDSYPGEADDDNNHVFGHAASDADAFAAMTLVKRYYAAAATGDGARACTLMYSILAESVPEDYGQAAGTQAAHAEGCAAVMSKLFERLHKQLRSDRATLKVGTVRIRRREASVLLHFGGKRQAYYLALHQERGAWKVNRLIATEEAIYVE